uniref:tRNA (adenine(58)-N(1))-methyltransferase non-catalytic subunit TRM6 n=1 Tax=Astatotilapia calliptera TaxID=8154 RepID=A0A3P8R9C8_ASTCA
MSFVMADNGDDDNQYRIKEGDYVVLKRGEIFKAVQIQPRKKVIFEKQWIFLDNAVRQLYSTTFEILSGGNLKPHELKDTASPLVEAGTDNRNIVDDGKSQKLTRDDIEALKEKGLKGQDIIKKLVDNHATFGDKTEYSQVKYIKKKKKKYENTVMILKPSCRILAMMYHGREPGKICHLRYDTLAQMLTLANIHAGSKVLVFETCAGLVLGSIMERMGGYGSVIQMYPGGGPVRAGVENFGFPAHFHDTLHEFPICHVNALLAGTLDTSAKDPTAENTHEKQLNLAAEKKQNQPEAEEQGTPEEESMVTNTGDDAGQDVEKTEKDKLKEAKVSDSVFHTRLVCLIISLFFTCRLIISSRFHPCPVLLGLLKFLSPSRPFVVYSQYIEPLIECFKKLKECGGTVNLRLTDTWLRHYQVNIWTLHCSPVLAPLYLSAGIVLGDVKLICSVMEIHALELPAHSFVLMFMSEEVWNSRLF